MKLKKYSYLLALIIMLLTGINGVEAKINNTCYYVSENKEATVKLVIGYDMEGIGEEDLSLVTVHKLGKKLDSNEEPIINWYENFNDSETGMHLPAINKGKSAAKKNKDCPKYLILRWKKVNWWPDSYGVFATEDEDFAKEFTAASDKIKNMDAWYLTYRNSDGSKITSEQYYSSFTNTGSIIDPNATITCDQLFGDKKDDGTPKEPPKKGVEDDVYDINRDGTASIAYMVDGILDYVRIIVPILIILVGTFDFAKAVISSKEDQMKHAQATFIKRLFLGLAVFMVPVFVDVVMWLADIVWEGTGYTSCQFR